MLARIDSKSHILLSRMQSLLRRLFWIESRMASALDVSRLVAVRSVYVRVRLRQPVHRRAWAKRKGRGARDGLVMRERSAMLVDRSQHTAAAVVDDERPFAARAVIEVPMCPEQPGELIEHLDRKYVAHRGRCYRLFHWNCEPPSGLGPTRANSTARANEGKARSTGPFAFFGRAAFQYASCSSMQTSSKCNEKGAYPSIPA